MQTETPAADLTQQIGRLASGDREIISTLLAIGGELAVNLALAALILVVTLWLSGRFSKIARRAIERMTRHHQADKTLETFVGSLVRYLVVAVGLIAVLSQLGVKTTSVVAVLGAASLAIGLALQGALSNVAAGVMLLVLRPYRIGDEVLISGQLGVVRSMDLFATRLVLLDGLDVFVPNGKVFGELLINYSTPARRRIEWDIGIDYDDDIDHAIAVLRRIAEADPRVLKSPGPWVKVAALADSAVTIRLRCWTTVEDWLATRHDLLKTIKQTFDAEGLTFPFPQQTASVREGVKLVAPLETGLPESEPPRREEQPSRDTEADSGSE